MSSSASSVVAAQAQAMVNLSCEARAARWTPRAARLATTKAQQESEPDVRRSKGAHGATRRLWVGGLDVVPIGAMTAKLQRVALRRDERMQCVWPNLTSASLLRSRTRIRAALCPFSLAPASAQASERCLAGALSILTFSFREYAI